MTTIAKGAGQGGQWISFCEGTTIGTRKRLIFDKIKARIFRLEIQEATEVPVIAEFQLFSWTVNPYE